MKSWLFWAGLSFVGGMISFGLTFGATGFISILMTLQDIPLDGLWWV